MIIKDKPLHILSAQFIQCAYFYPAGVLGCATRPYGVCTLDHMRRFSDFIKLEAYQVRLSRYLVMRRADAVFDRVECDGHFDAAFYDFISEAGRVGGVL
ncbi:hypothetical protein [Acidithiobacillus ferriphilus]|uniref:hypothetical protein n=1 Tax=Acidithiobacillus ferriphilus TaxID=1689834 RepID=UPI004055A847